MAIVDLLAPASGQRCVAYKPAVALLPFGHVWNYPLLHDLGIAVLNYGRTVGRSTVGIFLVDDGSGQALVWPYRGRTIIAGDEPEKIIRPGDTVYVMGQPRLFPELLSSMKEDCGPIPQELLQAVLQREELKSLPCFFGAGDGLIVANDSYDNLIRKTVY